MSLQAKFTAIAVNLKRIARIVSSSNGDIFLIIRIIGVKIEFKVKWFAGMVGQLAKST